MNTLIRIAFTLILIVSITSNTFAINLLLTCGNHIPHHCVTSPEKAEQLSKELHCTDWKVDSLKGMSVEQIAKLLNDAAELNLGLDKGQVMQMKAIVK